MKAAMEDGAAGATITQKWHLCPADSPLSGVSQARRECCSIIVSRQQVAAIGEALEGAGAFDERTHGLLCGCSVLQAFTYLG